MLSSKYKPRPRERLLMLVHGRGPACSSQGLHSCTHMHAGKRAQNPNTRSTRLSVSSFRLLKGQAEPRMSTEHTWNPGWKCRSSLKRQTLLSQFRASKREECKHASSFLCQKQRRHFKIKNRKCQRDRAASLQKLPLSKFRRVAFW